MKLRNAGAFYPETFSYLKGKVYVTMDANLELVGDGDED
jgi:hypothetical protein